MSDTPTLHELNAHLLARLLPDTHGLDVTAAADAPKAKGAKKAAKTEPEQPEQSDAPQYTAEQLEILKAAGIEDPAKADPQTLAAILGK